MPTKKATKKPGRVMCDPPRVLVVIAVDVDRLDDFTAMLGELGVVFDNDVPPNHPDIIGSLEL